MHWSVCRLVAGTALLALFSQASTGQVPPASRDKAIWIGNDIAFTTASVLSAHPSGDLTHQKCKDATCAVEIQVWVNPLGNDPSGRTCAFSGPSVIVLKNKNAKVTWTLKEINSTTNARFRDSSGADDGIRIYQSSAHFKNRSRQPIVFSWDRDDDNADGARVLLYDINVDNDLGRCDVPDPIIVNRD